MIVLDVVCRARVHGPSARRRGCCCPVDWGAAFEPPRSRRRYVRGYARHGGPQRSTEPEGDWAAVERAVGGDKSLRLTAAERDAAIDRLDRLGLSAREVAFRLGVTTRTVTRRRTARLAERAS